MAAKQGGKEGEEESSRSMRDGLAGEKEEEEGKPKEKSLGYFF